MTALMEVLSSDAESNSINDESAYLIFLQALYLAAGGCSGSKSLIWAGSIQLSGFVLVGTGGNL